MRMQFYMTNRQTGIVLIAISIIMLIVMLSVTDRIIKANSILHQGCNLPEEVCPYAGYPMQSVIGYALALGILAFGIFIFFFSEKPKRADFSKNIGMLKGDEKKLYGLVAEAGALFQGELVEKSGFSKVKVTRILDRLEGLQLVERKRRGMSNVVVLK